MNAVKILIRNCAVLAAGRNMKKWIMEWLKKHDMKDYREMPFMFERSGSKVIFDDRRYSSK